MDVRVVLAAHPADGGAVEGGARADVSLQAGQRLRLLWGGDDLREFKGQKLGRFVVAAIRQRRPRGNQREEAWLKSENCSQERRLRAN